MNLVIHIDAFDWIKKKHQDFFDMNFNDDTISELKYK